MSLYSIKSYPSTIDCFTIHMDNKARQGGDIIEGELEINVNELRKKNIDEVYVKLKGAIRREVVYSTGVQQLTDVKSDDIIKESLTLWTKSSPPHLTGSTLRCPFRFSLPPALLPSLKTRGPLQSSQAYIRYYVKAVGKRSAMLKQNPRAMVEFRVVAPVGDALMLRKALSQEGWRGHWRNVVGEKKISKGLLGTGCPVSVEFSLPDTPILPTCTPIPIAVTIITHTKPMKHSDSDQSQSHNLFPAPPHDPSDIELKLRRKIWFKAGVYDSTYKQDAMHIGGSKGKAEAWPQGRGETSMEVLERKWEGGDHGGKGSWVQGVVMRSNLVLDTPPTMEVHKALEISYYLEATVHFDGMRNNVEVECPITVASADTVA